MYVPFTLQTEYEGFFNSENAKHIISFCRGALQSLLSDPVVTLLYVSLQIYDNAMITAGLNDDPRPMISRLNDLLTKAMEKH